MTRFVGVSLEPAAPTNRFLETVGRRSASKNKRRIAKLCIEIQNFQTTLNEETTKTKVIDLKKVIQLLVYCFFI